MAPAQRRGHAVYRQQPRRVLLETFEDADGAIRAQPDEISRFDLHSSSSGVTMIGSSTIESRPLSLPASATPIRRKSCLFHRVCFCGSTGALRRSEEHTSELQSLMRR